LIPSFDRSRRIFLVILTPPYRIFSKPTGLQLNLNINLIIQYRFFKQIFHLLIVPTSFPSPCPSPPRGEGEVRGTFHGCHGRGEAYVCGLMIDYTGIFNYDVLYKEEEYERIHR
jgi:hypothetical protein